MDPYPRFLRPSLSTMYSLQPAIILQRLDLFLFLFSFFFLFSLFFLFFLRDSRGASMRFSPPLSSMGSSERFTPKDLFYSIYLFSKEQQVRLHEVFTLTVYPGRLGEVFTQGYFYSLFFVFDDQGVVGIEAKPCSTASTDFSTVSMNSCLERGFL